MYTQCPSCGTVFAVQAWQLRKATGWVSCGLCQSPFDALEALAEELPAGADVPAETAAPAADQPSATAETAPSPAVEVEDAAERPGEPYIPAPEGDAGAAATAGVEEWDELLSEIAPAVEQSAPGPGRWRPRRWRTAGRWGLALLGVTALLAGAVHGSYLYRAQLDGVPGAQPWLEAVCAAYGCDPGRSYRQALEVEQRRLERHPSREDVLILGAELRYTGGEPAPFPQMRLTLRDLDGHVTGQRWIGPEDYVADGRLRARLEDGVQPGMRIPVRLAVAEPEGGAESFSLAFRAPSQ